MKRRGFTLIEVTLVIALTTMLFIAFLASTAGTISARRYTDSVNNFTEFLRAQYGQVINVQSAGLGNTKDAIYGRVIFFGLKGNEDGTIYAYDIIGNAVGSGSLTPTSDIFAGNIGGNIIAKQGARCYPVNQEVHAISNGAWIEQKSEDPITNNRTLRGTMFIVRSPYTGTVTTKFIDRLPVPDPASYIDTNCTLDAVSTELSRLYLDATVQEINFCVASDDKATTMPRRNIRVTAGGNSSTAVQMIALDSMYNADLNPEGNKCGD